jgi:hypothetical protein
MQITEHEHECMGLTFSLATSFNDPIWKRSVKKALRSFVAKQRVGFCSQYLASNAADVCEQLAIIGLSEHVLS